MIVNIIVLSAIGIFIIYCIRRALINSELIGCNTEIPSLWGRIKPRMQAFIARRIINKDIYSEDHA